jgi:hypothetical protein
MAEHQPLASLIAREGLVGQSRCGFPEGCANVRCSPNPALGCATLGLGSCAVSSVSSNSASLLGVVNASINRDSGWRGIKVPDEDERFVWHYYRDNRLSERTFIDASHFEVSFQEQPRLCSGR